MKIKILRVTPVLASLCFVACSGDPLEVDADSASVAACDCDFAAADITFDNTESELESSSVQDAVDEVAVLSDVAARVSVVEKTDSSSGSTLSITVLCSTQNGGSVPLGGGCSTSYVDANLSSAELLDNGFRCVWTTEFDIEATARASCLALTP